MKNITLFLWLISLVASATEFDDTLKLAKEGNPEAQYNLGLMYANGDKGAPEDDNEAVKWYLKAARQGHVDAQFSLGLSYYWGNGVPEDFIAAYVWYSMSKTSGNENASLNIEFIRKMMSNQQIAEGQRRATMCYKSNYEDCD